MPLRSRRLLVLLLLCRFGGARKLHASLMARLDRVGPVKEVAQIEAAAGREFSHAKEGRWR